MDSASDREQNLATAANLPRPRTPLLERIGEMRALFNGANNEQIQQDNVEDGEVQSEHENQRIRSPSPGPANLK